MSDDDAASILQVSLKYPGALDKNIGPSWFRSLALEFEKPYFKALSEYVGSERASSSKTIFPPPGHVWSWTHDFEVKDTKVVILGQDPYHGPGQAHGLCFSVQPGVEVPPSLKNMFKELETDIEGFKNPGHGNLMGWAKQGVLLLNACLTVQQSKANSHKGRGWEQLTDAVVKLISDECSNVVFLLWGAFAEKKAAAVDKSKHHLLKGPHPSPLSAYRGFFGCKHFSKCNELLREAGKEDIDWARL